MPDIYQAVAKQKEVDSPNQFPRQPEEWFFKVVVGLGRDFEILKVLFSMKSDCACLDFPLLHRRFINNSSM
jgi:hypothetical protein